MVPKQATVHHPLLNPIKHPKLHRSYSNQQPHKTYHRVARQQSVQIPTKSSVSNRNVLRFHPTTPMVAISNVRGSMTPIAPTSKSMFSMTPSSKGMTYSLDRRQVQEVPIQNLHKDLSFHPTLKGNTFYFILCVAIS